MYKEGIKLNLLKGKYKRKPDPSPEHDVLYTRGYLLYVIGAVLFPSSSRNLVHPRYIQFIQKSSEISSYAWGAAIETTDSPTSPTHDVSYKRPRQVESTDDPVIHQNPVVDPPLVHVEVGDSALSPSQQDSERSPPPVVEVESTDDPVIQQNPVVDPPLVHVEVGDSAPSPSQQDSERCPPPVVEVTIIPPVTQPSPTTPVATIPPITQPSPAPPSLTTPSLTTPVTWWQCPTPPEVASTVGPVAAAVRLSRLLGMFSNEDQFKDMDRRRHKPKAVKEIKDLAMHPSCRTPEEMIHLWLPDSPLWLPILVISPGSKAIGSSSISNFQRKSAQEHVLNNDKNASQDVIPAVLNNIMGRKYVFKLTLNDKNTVKKYQGYTVTDVHVLEEITNEDPIAANSETVDNAEQLKDDIQEKRKKPAPEEYSAISDETKKHETGLEATDDNNNNTESTHPTIPEVPPLTTENINNKNKPLQSYTPYYKHKIFQRYSILKWRRIIYQHSVFDKLLILKIRPFVFLIHHLIRLLNI
ncbi:hypothetical protein POM88_053249 [Heracleum sosnowskyi]|uniref:Uncharacterized protein n=1 Tax=Heracleum sosnowskyi TaxID=360622 RepID=A0AAD8GPC0_9APIA|nr:hypothetical protein POM88_053249 [Heracleum sosnowskyi]